ncbi:MOSC N-terminal beta barrel domain-containing protein [Microbacterium sp. H1-D42]|uniref:MOSC domain-containing protein n=1 Tax=Microbacterium sp. H1-D42 TaxID=2925844 RepID=UPI001F534BD2|nr:MOSC N-terminal beta barrel domain-containing protein [Microbacterium sp. H1-D42]UNK70547.1 MOSC domain-containing protein [Microbacterium sp. H1-D42]
MPRVVALYRHPIKGFTPERLDELVVQPDGRIAGDRVLAFRFGNAVEPEDRDGLDYWPKSKGLALESFPTLAALQVSYDHDARRVRVAYDDELLIEVVLDAEGRAELTEIMTAFVLDSPEWKLLQREGRLPLVLVGDGESSRFQDRSRGFVSVHSHASIDALSDALGQQVDDRRFRSNVVIDGVDAWDELSWQGEVRIGDVRFSAEGPIVRCLATHANPDTGIRDAKVLTTLTRGVGLPEPTLGHLLLLDGVNGAVGDAAGLGGVIRVGDEVTFG